MLDGLRVLLGGASLGPEALISHRALTLSRRIRRGQDRQVVGASLAGSLSLCPGFLMFWLGSSTQGSRQDIPARQV